MQGDLLNCSWLKKGLLLIFHFFEDDYPYFFLTSCWVKQILWPIITRRNLNLRIFWTVPGRRCLERWSHLILSTLRLRLRLYYCSCGSLAADSSNSELVSVSWLWVSSSSLSPSASAFKMSRTESLSHWQPAQINWRRSWSCLSRQLEDQQGPGRCTKKSSGQSSQIENATYFWSCNHHPWLKQWYCLVMMISDDILLMEKILHHSVRIYPNIKTFSGIRSGAGFFPSTVSLRKPENYQRQSSCLGRYSSK